MFNFIDFLHNGSLFKNRAIRYTNFIWDIFWYGQYRTKCKKIFDSMQCDIYVFATGDMCLQ
jgi:hypothetical protein